MDGNKVVGGLGINTDVLEKMVSVAALEVDGVSAMANRAMDISGIVNSGSAYKPVKVKVKNGAVDIDLYITVTNTAKVKKVAEAVQNNVKDKLQDMTGNAITRVNVKVVDIAQE